MWKIPDDRTILLAGSRRAAMTIPIWIVLLLGTCLSVLGFAQGVDTQHGRILGEQDILGSQIDPERYRAACPDYKHYAVLPQYVWPDTRSFSSSITEAD